MKYNNYYSNFLSPVAELKAEAAKIELDQELQSQEEVHCIVPMTVSMFVPDARSRDCIPTGTK